MQLDHYDIIAGRNQKTFESVSDGPKGRIIKVIQFEEMSIPGLFNLAFGDKNILTDTLDDKIVTDNGDAEKVLATVVVYVCRTISQLLDICYRKHGSQNTAL